MHASKNTHPAVTNARFAALLGLPVALLPFDDARSTTQIRALVTRGAFAGMPRVRQASVCGSAADVALRLHFAMRSIPAFSPLSRPPKRRPKPIDRIRLRESNGAITDWSFHDSSIID